MPTKTPAKAIPNILVDAPPVSSGLVSAWYSTAASAAFGLTEVYEAMRDWRDCTLVECKYRKGGEVHTTVWHLSEFECQAS
jgi:hypothetical protein